MCEPKITVEADSIVSLGPDFFLLLCRYSVLAERILVGCWSLVTKVLLEGILCSINTRRDDA